MSLNTPTADRAALRAHTPDRYLANGWRGADGAAHDALSGWWATAAAEQLFAGHVAVQELQTTFEAFVQILPYYQQRQPLPGAEVAFEVLDLVASLLGQPNNPALVGWIEPCLLAVAEWDDARAFMLHLRAVTLQYAALARSAPPGP